MEIFILAWILLTASSCYTAAPTDDHLTGIQCLNVTDCGPHQACVDTDDDGLRDHCACQDGYYFNDTTCLVEAVARRSECRPGEYLNETSNECRKCPYGWYKTHNGSGPCQRCLVGAGEPEPTTTILGATDSAQCFPTPYIKRIHPLFGPRAGGTEVTIWFRFLQRITIEYLQIANRACNISQMTIDGRDNSSVTCLTGEVWETEEVLPSGVVAVHFNNGYIIYSDDLFQYRENPEIYSISRHATIYSGGLIILVNGSNFDSVHCPALEVTRVRQGGVVVFSGICNVHENRSGLMGCLTPDLHNHAGVSIKCNGDNTEFKRKRGTYAIENVREYIDPEFTKYYIGFRLDGFNKYKNLSDTLPGQGRFKVHPNPTFDRFEGSDGALSFREADKYIRIKGHRLNYAATERDYNVTVGRDVCKVVHLATNQLTCQPPWPEPEVEGTSYRRGLPRVTVHVGLNRRLTFVIGYLNYNTGDSYSKPAIIAGSVIVAVVAVCFVVALSIYIYKKRHKSQPVGLNEFVSTRNAAVSNGRPLPVPGQQRISTISANNSGAGRPLIAVNTQGSSGSTTFSEVFYPSTPLSVNSLPIDFMLEVAEELRLVQDGCTLENDRLILGDVIGQGCFGQVFKGTLLDENRQNPRIVAVKTIQSGYGVTAMDVKAFLKEATLMKDFNHPHVLGLVGVTIRENRPYVILPFMEYNDLRAYISEPARRIKVRELLAFGVQIASGMAYLAEKKFVHRDLATRNCMINKSLIVKIADFGLSRDVYQSDYYRVENKHRPLPVKWMAIESLTLGVFSTKSDVWSFGVLVWELLTRGSTPYPNVDTFSVKSYLLSGRRLHQPEFAPDEVFAIMCSCWKERPEERPTFPELEQTIQNIVNNKRTATHPDYLQLV